MIKTLFLFIISFSLLFVTRVFSQEDLDMQISPEDLLDSVSTGSGKTEIANIPSETPSEAASVDNSIIQINPVDEKEALYSFELRDAEVSDVFRILAHDYKLNLMVDKDVQGKVTATLSSVTLDEALEAIAESQNLVLEKKSNIVKVSPNLITKTFTLKYIEAKSIVESAENSSSASTDSGSSAAGAAVPSAASPGETSGTTLEASGTSPSKKANTVYDLLSDKGMILLGKQPNSVMVIDYPPNLKKVEEYLKAIDRKMTSKFFKLKYLKAADVVGESSAGSTDDSSSAAPAPGTDESSSSSTSLGSTS